LSPFLAFVLTVEQIVDGKQDLEKFSNAFINLALPFFGFSDPIAAAKQKVSSSSRDRGGRGGRGSREELFADAALSLPPSPTLPYSTARPSGPSGCVVV